MDAGWSSKTNWITDEPLEIVAGGYDGTEWTEEDIEFDTPCAITKKIDTDDYVGKVTKTRDGYFVLDTSKFKPGKYVLSFYNPNNWYGGQTNLFNGAYMITIV